MQKMLESLAGRLGIEVHYESMIDNRWSSVGGLCRLNSRQMIFVNAGAPPIEQVGVLLDALGQMNLEALFIAPAVRRELTRRRR
jgi:hypothetical protein